MPPKPDPGTSKPKPEASKATTTAPPGKPAADKDEKAKSTKGEQSKEKPAPAKEQGKPTPAKEQGNPTPAKEQGKPTPAKEQGKPTPAKEQGKPTPAKEQGKPTPAKEQGKPTPAKEQGKTTGEKGKPPGEKGKPPGEKEKPTGEKGKPTKVEKVTIKEPEKLIKEPEKPIKEPEKPIKEPEKPIKEPEKPIKEPEKPIKELEKEQEKPLKELEKPIKEQGVPTQGEATPTEKAGISTKGKATPSEVKVKQSITARILNMVTGTAQPTKENLTVKDIFVIVTLWSVEIVYKLTEGWKSLFFIQDSEDIQQRVPNLAQREVGNVIMIIFLVITLVFVSLQAFVVNGKKKFTHLLALIAIYSLVTPANGMLLLYFPYAGILWGLIVLEAFWITASALRFWYIFHQKFPLSVAKTRCLVACNEIVLHIADYIAEFVMLSLIGSLRWVHVAVLVIILVLAVIWVVAIFVSKPFLNKAEDEEEIVRNAYEEAGLLDGYKSRQHTVLILCLIFPSMTMSLVKGAVAFLFKAHQSDLPLVGQIRIDLIVGIVFLALVAVMLIWLNAIRQELRDLLVIGIAHILNVFVCAYLLALTISHDPVPVTSGREYFIPPGAFEYPHDAVFAVVMYPEYPGLNLSIRDPRKEYFSYQTTGRITWFVTNWGNSISIVGDNPDGTTLFEAIIEEVTSNEGYYVKDEELVKIKDFFRVIKPEVDYGRMLFISSLKPCEEGPRFDELGTRVAYRGGCHSVQIYLTTRNKKTKEIGYDMEKINFPVLGEVQPAVGELVFNLSWSLEFLAYWHLDGKPVEVPAHFDKDSVEKSPFLIWFANFDKPFPPDYLYQYKYLKPNISKPSSSTSTTSATPTADKLNLVSQHGTTITVLLCFSSVAIVVASASYIHFLWIQCPSKHRVLILAAFFSLNFLGSWLTAFCLSGLQTTQLVVQLSFQVFGCVWHLGSAIIFWRKLRQLRDDEKKNIKNMLF